MTDTLRLYYRTFKELEELALDLEEAGITDSPAYLDYQAYKAGYELARREMLDYLGITVK